MQELQISDYRQQAPRQLKVLKGTLNNLTPNPLPNPLPREPDPPFAPLVQINNRLLAARIDPDAQWVLAGDLEKLIFDGGDPTETARLLSLFQRRPDLTVPVSRKLDRLKSDHPASPIDHPPIDPPRPVVKMTPPPPSEPTAGTIRHDAKGIEQVYVPAGQFMMGSDPAKDKDTQEDEKPAHLVRITRPFWLDRTPVTNAAYQTFMDDGGYRNRTLWTPEGWQWRNSDGAHGAPANVDGFGEPNQPRIGVSWYEAMAYAIGQKLSKKEQSQDC